MIVSNITTGFSLHRDEASEEANEASAIEYEHHMMQCIMTKTRVTLIANNKSNNTN